AQGRRFPIWVGDQRHREREPIVAPAQVDAVVRRPPAAVEKQHVHAVVAVSRIDQNVFDAGKRPWGAAVERDLDAARAVVHDADLVVGRVTDNQVSIVDNGTRGIQVTLDGGTPRTFTGIEHVLINTGDGNDSVDVLFFDSSGRTADYRIDLGRGDDRFSFTVPLIPYPYREAATLG